MSSYIKPIHTTNRVKTAGKRFRDGNETPEDGAVLDNWRASHLYVINTFQASLRARAKGKPIQVAQRLKRKPTIIDKLRREPNMQLSTMQDLAGCRLIFEDTEQLAAFRHSMLTARFDHECRSIFWYEGPNQPAHGGLRIMTRGDRYNYIDQPKPSGYRGIHDVYRYNVNTQGGKIYNGMHIEIQYRTIYQHAWATAVEVADLLTSNRIKFSQGGADYQRYFVLASDIIARAWEQSFSYEDTLTDKALMDEFAQLEHKTNLLQTFKHLQTTEQSNMFKMNSILIMHFEPGPNNEFNMEVENYYGYKEAVTRYEVLEAQLAGKADVVLVRSDSEAAMRSAFRNYFSDTRDFIDYIQEGLVRLALNPVVV